LSHPVFVEDGFVVVRGNKEESVDCIVVGRNGIGVKDGRVGMNGGVVVREAGGAKVG
jgi:hypothetical protein